MSSWRGIKVRNKDGRAGEIVRDHEALWTRNLVIRTEGGEEATVTLDSRGPDYGEAGWQWLCVNFAGKAVHWLPLGDHSGTGTEPYRG
jgi:hypothetical protein